MNFLTIDEGKTYLCHYGCSTDFRVPDRIRLFKHLYSEHSFDELKVWGINRDLLKEAEQYRDGYKKNSNGFVNYVKKTPTMLALEK